LKSRAAFKLLEVSGLFGLECGLLTSVWQIDAKYRLFKKGQTVVDLVCIHD
jgi:23S rRNA U2552 (ribose-2'-O)-methylase RlmE/FtsJ